MTRTRRILVAGAVLGAGLLALAAGPGASLADTSVSSNWAGYVAHRANVRFHRVSASWRQVSPVCVPGSPAFSSVWVGLGGYSRKSTALEQVGTEADCTQGGRVSSAAWYEVLPEPARSISLRIRPGDLIRASVVITRTGATFQLTDQTTGRTFHKSLRLSRVDVSSADWIVETPAGCRSPFDCHILPLANFGSATINAARARTASGRAGSITSPAWGHTRVVMETDVDPANPGEKGVTAMPSPLRNAGSSFTVNFLPASSPLVRPGLSPRRFPSGRRP